RDSTRHPATRPVIPRLDPSSRDSTRHPATRSRDPGINSRNPGITGYLDLRDLLTWRGFTVDQIENP
ncbi:MAG: hypothetical protein OER87_14190, partial [Gammaproteobacteria bacterium]|nr:hypothetical protein [Gammaproteobacteria bacterium]